MDIKIHADVDNHQEEEFNGANESGMTINMVSHFRHNNCRKSEWACSIWKKMYLVSRSLSSIASLKSSQLAWASIKWAQHPLFVESNRVSKRVNKARKKHWLKNNQYQWQVHKVNQNLNHLKAKAICTWSLTHRQRRELICKVLRELICKV